MVSVISKKNGCVYTLDPVTLTDLLYTPIRADDSFSTYYSDYDYVEWEAFQNDIDTTKEAKRCYHTLSVILGRFSQRTKKDVTP